MGLKIQSRSERKLFQKIHEVKPYCTGKVMNVYVTPSTYVYEWEPLFSVMNGDGKITEVYLGVSGIIKDIKVTVGEHVFHNTILANIEDDMKLSGSD